MIVPGPDGTLPTRLGSTRLGLAWLGLARLDLARVDSTADSRKWQYRWFLLEGNVLKYFTSESVSMGKKGGRGKPKGAFTITKHSTVEQSDGFFKVLTHKKKLRR